MPKMWIIPANSKSYNHAKSFRKNGFIDWRQTKQMKNIEIGDIVYVYLAERPCGKIRFKTKVIENIASNSKTNDYEFWLNVSKAEYEQEIQQYQFLRLELLAEVDDNNLSLKTLRAKGFINEKNNMQSVLQIKNNDFLKYLNVYFRD